jgi:hypothetical protein
MIGFDLEIVDRSKPLIINLDSTQLADVKLPVDSKSVWLQKDAGDWRVSSEPPADKKNPNRYGMFKGAFRNDVLFVYGTHGTRAENEWAFDKARYDAEYFWYQGNGSIDIVSDKDFDLAASPDRSVIIYGNEKTNSAWGKLLEGNPVTVSKGRITVGESVLKGDDYTCFMVRPRKGTTSAVRKTSG